MRRNYPVCSRSMLDTITHSLPRRRTSPRTVGDLARERIGGSAGHRRRTEEGEGNSGRSALGFRLPRASPIPRAQSDHLRLADAGRPASLRALVGIAARRERLSRHPAGRRSDADPAAAEGTRPAPRPADDAALAGIRHGHHRRRAGGSRRRGVRRFRRPAHHRRRARGSRRPGRDLVADRELSRLPERHLGRRTGQPRPCARRGGSARRFSSREASSASIPRPAPSSSTAAKSCRRGPSSSRPGSAGGVLRSTASTG